jgi:hypothetical protein
MAEQASYWKQLMDNYQIVTHQLLRSADKDGVAPRDGHGSADMSFPFNPRFRALRKFLQEFDLFARNSEVREEQAASGREGAHRASRGRSGTWESL